MCWNKGHALMNQSVFEVPGATWDLLEKTRENAESKPWGRHLNGVAFFHGILLVWCWKSNITQCKHSNKTLEMEHERKIKQLHVQTLWNISYGCISLGRCPEGPIYSIAAKKRDFFRNCFWFEVWQGAITNILPCLIGDTSLGDYISKSWCGAEKVRVWVSNRHTSCHQDWVIPTEDESVLLFGCFLWHQSFDPE